MPSHDKLKTALVTGASSGIGLELARQCARHGHDVILVGRNEDRLKVVAETLRNDYNIQTHTFTQDLSQSGAAAAMARQLDAEDLDVDILVNNAGVGMGGPFIEHKPERITALLQLNITTLTELTRLLLPAMVKRHRGRVLNVASIAAFMPGPLMAEYYASKAYVLSLSLALAEELDGTGISVTALCPGPTETGFWDVANMRDSRLVGGNIETAADVAQIGYQAMMAGKAVSIPGVRNKALAQAPRLVSRRLMARLVRKAQGRKRG